MTAQEWYQSRQGQSLLVPGADPSDRGQCAQAADYALKEIYGLPYVWANAIDWWGLPQSLNGNFTQITDGSIKAGDFVIYNQKIGSVYGHVDVALQDGNVNNFVAADSNWAGKKDTNPQSPTYGYPILYQVSHVGQAGYIIGALRSKGATMTPNALNELAQAAWNKDASDSEVQALIKNYTGKSPDETILAVLTSASNKDLRNKAANYQNVANALQSAYNTIDELKKEVSGDSNTKLTQLQSDIQTALDKSKG